MENEEASCVFYVKVCMFTQLEQSKICHLTVKKTGIVRLTVQHDGIVSIGFMNYPGDYLRQTSAVILSLEECPLYIWHCRDFSCDTPQFVLGNEPTTLDGLIADRVMVGNPCNSLSYAAGFMLSIMYKLAATYCILTWRSLYIPQDLPLHFVIIFLSLSTPANHRYTTTSAGWWRIRSKPINWRFIWYFTPWPTAGMQTPVSPPQCYQWSHQNMTKDAHFNIVRKTGSSKNTKLHASWCEYIHTLAKGRQLTV